MRKMKMNVKTSMGAIQSHSYIFTILIHTVIAVNWPEIENHPAWKVLEHFECGDSAADRIIGGVNAALGQFPWIARLGYTATDDRELDWLCGGALITDRHVVTAAHCVQAAEDTKLTLVRLGELDNRTDPDCQLKICAPPVQDMNVKSVKSHENFNNPIFHNDIAIIELVAPVNLNDYVTPICLPRKNELGNIHIGELVTVAGWGKMNMSTEERAQALQMVQLPIVSPQTCNLMGKSFKLTESEICAGAQQNKDACGGDSGGPLMKVFDTPEGPKSFLMGVVSFGPTVCGIKKPGVYSSVSHFLNWILDKIV